MPRLRLAILAVTVTICGIFGYGTATAGATVLIPPVRTASTVEVETIIRAVWAPDGPVAANEAVAVARCESGLNPNPPHNNPHYGVFQMGSHEFASYGVGSTFNPWNNVAAAHRYWSVTGKRWGPWSCKPYGHPRRHSAHHRWHRRHR